MNYNFAIFSHNMPSGYSGGRYHSWVLAESLATLGCNVDYYTNFYPECYTDFQEYKSHDNINVIKEPAFINCTPNLKYDYVILVPSAINGRYFYKKVEYFTLKSKAKLIFLNFESGNWFNHESPWKKDFDHWFYWQKACQSGAIILSSNKTSEHYARKFYNRFTKNLEFITSFPPINNKTAETVKSLKLTKDKSISFFVRFRDQHKGGNDILDHFFCYELKGYTFKFFVGVGTIFQETKIDLYKKAKKYNIKLKLLYHLSDELKLMELSKSNLLVFPSYFEGYGYPPVEGRALDIPVVCYDLPVLKEVNSDDLFYVPKGDVKALKEKSLEILEVHQNYQSKHEVQTIYNYGKEITDQLAQIGFEMTNPNLRLRRIKAYFILDKLIYWPYVVLKNETNYFISKFIRFGKKALRFF